MKDLYTKKNYKTLMKNIKQDTNWKTSHAHEMEVLIVLQCPYYPKWSTDVIQSL